MNYLFSMLLFGLATAQTWAAASAPPVDLFLQELFLAEDFRERWKPESWENYSSERNDPNGGYLFRFELELGPGHQNFVFLATDRFGEVTRNRPAWNVYRKGQDSTWKKVATSEMLSVDEIYVDQSSPTIIQRFPDRFQEGTSYSILKFNADGTTEKRIYRSEDIDGVLRDKLEKLSVRVVPNVEKTPLAAYLRSRDLRWRPLSRSLAVSAQSLDVADAALLASANKLELAEAIDMAKANLLPSEAPKPSKTPARLDDVEPLTISPASHTSAPMSPKSSSPWPMVVVLVAMTAGLLWFLLKRRK